jgi:hypothetical protein
VRVDYWIYRIAVLVGIGLHYLKHVPHYRLLLIWISYASWSSFFFLLFLLHLSFYSPDARSGSITQNKTDMQGRASRYGPTASSQQSNATSLSPTPSGTGEKERFGQDANMWDAGFEGLNPEADDYLHNPDPKRDRKVCPLLLSHSLSYANSVRAQERYSHGEV